MSCLINSETVLLHVFAKWRYSLTENLIICLPILPVSLFENLIEVSEERNEHINKTGSPDELRERSIPRVEIANYLGIQKHQQGGMET